MKQYHGKESFERCLALSTTVQAVVESVIDRYRKRVVSCAITQEMIDAERGACKYRLACAHYTSLPFYRRWFTEEPQRSDFPDISQSTRDRYNEAQFAIYVLELLNDRSKRLYDAVIKFNEYPELFAFEDTDDIVTKLISALPMIRAEKEAHEQLR